MFEPCFKINCTFLFKRLILFFLEALRKYKNKNKRYPKVIIIYRDGVGEGQIPEVKDTEVKSIKVSESKEK